MVITIIMGVAGGLIAKAVVHCVWKFWLKDVVDGLPIPIKTELSETDNKKIEETRELIRNKFGEDVADTVAKADEKERAEMMGDFAKELAQLYGLEMDIDITVGEGSVWGCYDPETNKAVFNIAALMIDSNDESFKVVVFEVVDTIIHELRHAVQYKAIEDPEFWNTGKKRSKIWKANMKNYIRAGVDPKGHANQPVEADAVTFADAVLSEVK